MILCLPFSRIELIQLSPWANIKKNNLSQEFNQNDQFYNYYKRGGGGVKPGHNVFFSTFIGITVERNEIFS